MAVFFVLAFAAPVLGETSHAPRFVVQGDTLIFDSDHANEDGKTSIVPKDADTLREILRATPGITTLQLNSGGGQVWAANKMSDIVIDFGLDTHVHGDCDSSCVTVFLGGKARSMSRGSRIGFHQIYWNAGSIESYYEREREENGWDTPFDFASWMYLDTQDEIYAHLKYMIARGVDPAFAIETLQKPSNGMWRPYRIMLRGVGVLTE
jgi:hypothetical protein